MRRLAGPGIPPKAEKTDPVQRGGRTVQPRAKQAAWSPDRVCDLVTVRVGRGQLEWSLPQCPCEPARLAERIARLGLVVVEDHRTAARVAQALRGQGVAGRSGATGQFVDLAATTAGSPGLAVLGDVLDRTFWRPDGVTSVAGWCAAFGVTHTFDGWLAMLGHALRGRVAGRQMSMANGVHAIESSLAQALRYMGRSGSRSNSVFSLTTRLAAATAGYEAMDPLGHREALRTGDAVLVNPVQDKGTTLTAVLSSPIRFRPGTLALYRLDGHFVGTVNLREITWNPRDRCQVGVISTQETRSGSGDGRAYTGPAVGAMRASMGGRGPADVFVATPDQYVRSYEYRPDSIWADGDSSARAPREVPLDVALAGAPR